MEGRTFGHAGIFSVSPAALNTFRARRLAIGASTNIGIYLLHPYLKAYGEQSGATETSRFTRTR